MTHSMSTRCIRCGKTRGEHKAVTYECPKGMVHRASTRTMYGPERFMPPPTKGKSKS